MKKRNGLSKLLAKGQPSTLARGLIIALSACLLSSCSIKDETLEEKKIAKPDASEEPISTPVEAFIAECNKCIQGDMSRLEDIIVAYQSTITKGIDYTPYSFAYQQIKPTQAFEQCAQKARQVGRNEAFDAIVLRPALNARIARYFYTQGQLTQGAYWLQRLINMRGEKDALEVAGRSFIQDPRTMSIGVKLLEQSARLGHKNARQVLLGLMSPGSLYYQQITQVDYSENQDGENQSMEQKQKDKAKEQPKFVVLGNAQNSNKVKEATNKNLSLDNNKTNQNVAKVETKVNGSEQGTQIIINKQDPNAVTTTEQMPVNMQTSEQTIQALNQDQEVIDDASISEEDLANSKNTYVISEQARLENEQMQLQEKIEQQKQKAQDLNDLNLNPVLKNTMENQERLNKLQEKALETQKEVEQILNN